MARLEVIQLNIRSEKQTILSFEQYTLFYKQLQSGPSPQSCLYFQDFQGSKLLKGA